MILTHSNSGHKYEVIFIRDNKEIHTGIKSTYLNLSKCKMIVKNTRDNQIIDCAMGWWFVELDPYQQ